LANSLVGTIKSIWRYPVKSLQGEKLLTETEISSRGVVGDRAYALLDEETGYIVSAKHPRKWGILLQCRAAYCFAPTFDAALPPVQIIVPNGG
jgi:uncharacterized protein